MRARKFIFPNAFWTRDRNIFVKAKEVDIADLLDVRRQEFE